MLRPLQSAHNLTTADSSLAEHVLTVSLLIAAICLVFALIWLARRSGELRRQLEAARQLQASEARYRESERQARELVRKLEAEQLRFSKVAATVPGALCTFQLEATGVLRIPYASRAFEDLFGLPGTDLVARIDSFAERMPPDHVARLEASLAESASGLLPWRLEFQYDHPARGAIWVEGHAMPVREQDGATVWHGIISDISERKAVEEARQRSSARLAAVIAIGHALASASSEGQLYATAASGVRQLYPDASTVLISHYDTQLELLTAVAGFHGDDPADVAALPALTLAPSDAGAWGDAIRQQRPCIHTAGGSGVAAAPPGAAGQAPCSALYVPMLAQGQVLGLIELQSPARFGEGDAGTLALVANTAAVCLQNVRLYDLAQRELAERAQAEASLRASERHFATIFDASPAGIAISRLRDTRIEDANPAILALLGYTREQAVGRTAIELGIWDSLEERERIVALMQRAGRIANVEATWRRSTGERRTVLISAELIALNGEPSTLVQVNDITERKAVELALRTSEELYRGLMGSLDSVVATVDAAGVFHYMNDVAARALGGTPAALVGRTMAELFPAPVADAQLANIRRAISEDTAVVNEYLSVVRGRPRWHRTTIQPIHGETGEVIYALLNATDIHDLKQAQEELLELNQNLEQRVRQRTAEVADLYEHAPAGYHSLDAEGRLIRINQTLLDWLGYARDELVGRPFTAILSPEGEAIFRATFPVFKRSGVVQGVELELLRKDGSAFPALFSATAVYDEAGEFVMSRSTSFDITERKAAEAALRESEGRNRLLFEASPEAMALFDARGAMARVNNAFELLVGRPGAQLRGRRLDELGLLTERGAAALAAALEQARSSDSPAAAELQLAGDDAREVAARVFGLLIGGEQHYLAALRDVTAERQAAAALRRANLELARAARAKDEFLANMSHELRTPLNAVLAFSESLLDSVYGPLTAHQQGPLRHITASGGHLLALINDILDLSKAEAGQLELRLEPVVVGELCRASLLFVREQAVRKALTLMLDVQDRALLIAADPVRLKQMLVNLLSNAVKFTPEGGSVRLVVTSDAAAGVVRFAVEDTGIGIAAEDLPRLFQPFVQLDSSLNRQYEGTGLGLALVRRLAELHGGSCAVESEPGRGSRFVVTLPQLPAAPAEAAPGALPPELLAAPAPPDPAPAGARVLLVEDNEDSVQVIGEYLQAKGFRVTVARNGQEALDRVAAARPDLILMDIQMPTLDGLEAIRLLRARPDGAAIPVIALTALAMPGDRERCLAAGASAYLAKPVSLKGLVATIGELLGG